VASNVVGRSILDDKTMRLLKALREQLGETSASRTVDAAAAANSLGTDRGTLDFHRSLHDLVRNDYLRGAPEPRTEGAGQVPDHLRGYSRGRQPLAPLPQRWRPRPESACDYPNEPSY